MCAWMAKASKTHRAHAHKGPSRASLARGAGEQWRRSEIAGRRAPPWRMGATASCRQSSKNDDGGQRQHSSNPRDSLARPVQHFPQAKTRTHTHTPFARSLYYYTHPHGQPDKVPSHCYIKTLGPRLIPSRPVLAHIPHPTSNSCDHQARFFPLPRFTYTRPPTLGPTYSHRLHTTTPSFLPLPLDHFFSYSISFSSFSGRVRSRRATPWLPLCFL